MNRQADELLRKHGDIGLLSLHSLYPEVFSPFEVRREKTRGLPPQRKGGWPGRCRSCAGPAPRYGMRCKSCVTGISKAQLAGNIKSRHYAGIRISAGVAAVEDYFMMVQARCCQDFSVALIDAIDELEQKIGPAARWLDNVTAVE